MKVVLICVSAWIALVAGAPTILNSIPDYLNDRLYQYRDKRSKIAHSIYPIGGVSSQFSSFSPYQWNVRPYVNPYAFANYGYQSMYGCGRGLFKSDEREDDRDPSDTDPDAHRHTDTSGTNPQLTPTSLASMGQLVAPAGGPAYGMFPNVPNAGCNVPFLFSCAPTIVPGRIMRGPQYGFGPFGAFRDVDNFGYDSTLQDQAAHENVATGDGSQVTKN
ncbi:unnamed protein product [Leptosia nina]|uniref:Uncharacterized protein n=1 Tax=Leptosia nina TaxID=320188 RepID=A0AAV1J9V7_9NEOP